MKRALAVLAVFGVMFACTPAFAGMIEVTFGDMSTSWGKWGIPPATVTDLVSNPWSSPPSSGAANTVDEWGEPIFNVNNSTSGQNKAVFSGGKLHSLTIAYHNPGASYNYWECLKPGDVFIDVGFDGRWDYVARTPFFDDAAYFNSNGTPTEAGNAALAAKWAVYSLPGGLDYWHDQDVAGNPGGPYQLADQTTRADTGGSWSGFTLRNYHPWALDSASVIGLTQVAEATLTGALFNGSPGVSTTGWVNLDGKDSSYRGESTWTFSNDLLVGSTTVVFGFTVNCANEVLLGDVPVPLGQPEPVPEPTSLAIWSIIAGLGAAGATVARRRRTAGRGRWSSESRQAILEIIEQRCRRV